MGGALERQGFLGVAVRLREQFRGPILGIPQVEKGLTGLLEQFPPKLEEVQGDVAGSARFLPGVARGQATPSVRLAPEDAVSISLGQSCVFFWPPTFGLQSPP